LGRPAGGLNAELDHLVLAARTLAEGVAWCEETLGITPGPGGKHASMGTHNRTFAIGSAAFPRAYFEIIAIDPDAPPGRARWFELDAAALQSELARGPRLVHWVARSAGLDAAVAVLAGQGVDAGRVLQASRATPRGELRWRIAVRDDGHRLFGGALPMLIEWGTMHPADTLTDSGVTLASLTLGASDDAALQRALQSLGLVMPSAVGPALRATLNTPRGSVILSSPP
jgi:hypothetical protein